MLGAPVHHLIGLHRLAGARGDVRFHFIFAQLGRHGNYGAIKNPFVPLDYVFHFLRGDILAAAADDVFLTVNEIEIIVVVQPSQVAGEQPTVAQREGRLLLVSPVTGHGGRGYRS